MGEIDRPNMRNYGRQLFICSHGDCAPAAEAERLQRLVLERNRQQQLNKLRNPHGSSARWRTVSASARAARYWSSILTGSGITVWMSRPWNESTGST